MKILVTGFEPFGGEKVNPALEAIKGLPAEIHGAEVRWLEVPTVFHKSAHVLEEEMESILTESERTELSRLLNKLVLGIENIEI